MALFIFGIGGTGARVMKALVMLLASGVKLENTDTVIPILLDPDTNNGDLTRTVEILKHYQTIHRKAGADGGFFNTRIKSLNELGDGGGSEDQFRYDIEGVSGAKFGEFIGHNESMNRANRAITSMLYSEANLASDMQVGFKGNPHIGSVVLNKLSESALFKKFALAVEPNDRVFIISSIFGGTGAAGFPLLVKNIRGAGPAVPNHARLRDIPLGAVTVLPYFSVDGTDKKTTINSDSFITKTKAALSYYDKNLTSETHPRLNALYYIGDNGSSNMQAGADGAQAQKNKAHFAELASALSVVEFMKLESESLKNREGVALSPKYLEYGIVGMPAEIKLGNFHSKSHETASHALTQYYLFLKFYRDHYQAEQGGRWGKDEDDKLLVKNFSASFKDNLTAFNKYYEEWLHEMELSQISFKPFKRSGTSDDLLKFVDGFEEKPGWLADKGLKYFVSTLNRLSQKESKGLDSHTKLLQLFFKAAQSIIVERIKL